MDYFSIVIVVVVVLMLSWSLNHSTIVNYRNQINRLERKVDYLYRRFELDYAKEQGASVPAGVRELALSGNKIQAIKLYREATGVGLKEAKDAVDNIVAGGSAYPPQPATFDYPPTARPNMGLSPEVMRLVEQGNKIQAIKIYREQTNLGLKEAKDAVDLYEREIKLK